jgi:hypothetical protein
MDRYRSWNRIANGFYAADKIKNLITSPISNNQRASVMESNLSAIIEVLRIIGEYSPDNHRPVINNIVEKSTLYSNAYQNLKDHIQSNAGNTGNLDSVAKALSIIKPVVSNNPGITIEKVLKIYEIIKS